MRRAYRDGRTTSQRPPVAGCTSITDTPCAAWDLRTLSRVQVFMPSACSRPSSAYSWFITSRPARRAFQREEVDAVVVHAELGFLLGRGV